MARSICSPISRVRRLPHRVGERLGAGAMTLSSIRRKIRPEPNYRPQGSDAQRRYGGASRFREEARTAMTLEHAHIVHTYRMLGKQAPQESPDIAMELVEGESLSDLLERHRQLSVAMLAQFWSPSPVHWTMLISTASFIGMRPEADNILLRTLCRDERSAKISAP